MDQTTFEGLLQTFQARCSAENAIKDLAVSPGQATNPIVVLVHGIGGDHRHWADPVNIPINETWLYNINAKPTGDAKGLVSSVPYDSGAVTPWCQFLSSNGITCVNFSQSRPMDLIQYAIDELVALLSGLESIVFHPYEADVAANGGQVPPLIIICHSRGGLVTRAALKQLGILGVPHLRKVITLSTPHQGSYLPRLADDYNKFLHDQIDFRHLTHFNPLDKVAEVIFADHLTELANKVREALLSSTGGMGQSPGFDELIPASNFLQTLAQDEQPLFGVNYFGFGGSEPHFVTYYLHLPTGPFPLINVAGGVLLGLLAKIPGVGGNYGGLAEMDQGDSMVSLTSSQWPSHFNATHQNFKYNHMQALVDKPLQEAVIQIVRS